MYIDLEMEMYLKRLEDNIRSQSYWVVLPEESKWRNDQLGGGLSYRWNICASIIERMAGFRKWLFL